MKEKKGIRKRGLAFLLALAMAVSMTACGKTDTESESTASAAQMSAQESAADTTADAEKESALLRLGSYTGTANGKNGDVVVEVSVTETGISDVKVVEHQESAGFSDPAIERIPSAIVEYQSLAVDTITGATITSQAILAAVEDALTQAGADIEALKNVAIEKTAGEKVEKTADVIVVGGGGAGLSAAVAVAESGKTVILIEKTASLGGNTLASGGVWNAVNEELDAQTPSDDGRLATLNNYLAYDESIFEGEYLDAYKTLKGQIEEYLAGDTSSLFDSVEFHLIQSYIGGRREGLDGSIIYGDYDLLLTLTSKSRETMDWICEVTGAEFKDSLQEPGGALWLRARAPKTSKVYDLIELPAEYITANKGEILFECAAESLIVEDGRVTGVNASYEDGTPVVLKANNGVVLATGGFAADLDMVREYDNYWGDYLKYNILSTSVNGTKGDGIKMAQEAVDAAVTGMGYAQLNPRGYASNGTLAVGTATNCMYVAPDGLRFVNEYAERDSISRACFDKAGEDGLFYEIGLKSNCKTWQAEDCFEADTIEELAVLIGMDPEVLSAEVAKYNTYVDNHYDEDFGKRAFTNRIEIEGDDKYSARALRPTLHHTMGGLLIDTDCHVMNNSGEIVPGLYAAGEVAGGIHAGNRLGGNAIADIYVFGRIAGTNAADAR